eukprot:2233528-Rhodomonas_salina.1
MVAGQSWRGLDGLLAPAANAVVLPRQSQPQDARRLGECVHAACTLPQHAAALTEQAHAC